MSIDKRSSKSIDLNNIHQVKDSYNKFMLKAYQHFDCQDEKTLDIFEEFYESSDFVFNPTGYDRDFRKYFEWEDFAYSKVAESADLFCQLEANMEGDTRYEFESNWRDLIYDLESCVECQQGRNYF